MAKNTAPIAAEEHVATNDETGLSASGEYPGQTMGIVALVLSFFLQLPALILGIVAWVWSNKAGVSNVPAKVAVAVSAVLSVLGILVAVGWLILVLSAVGGIAGLDAFDGMGPRGLRS